MVDTNIDMEIAEKTSYPSSYNQKSIYSNYMLFPCALQNHISSSGIKSKASKPLFTLLPNDNSWYL